MDMVIVESKVRELISLQDRIDSLSKEADVLRDYLKSVMSEEGVYEIEGENWKVSWNMIGSNRFNQGNFKQSHPELFEQYVELSESRRFLLNRKGI